MVPRSRVWLLSLLIGAGAAAPAEGHTRRGQAPPGAPWTLPERRVPVAPARGGESFAANVPRPECGPGSKPETALQGQVPLEDQLSGRSSLGYTCNLELIGQYAGEGAGIMMAWHGDCAYLATGYVPADPEYESKKGTYVIDASDVRHPKPTARLSTPAMVNPWEALKANARRGLLATGEGGSFPLTGPGAPGPHFDIYDVSQDCRHPKLLASKALPDARGHEGEFTADGMTYWQSTMTGAPAPSAVAIDVSDPRNPRQLGAYANPLQSSFHAVQLSPDGNRGYFMAARGPGDPSRFNGLEIFDTSEVQSRKPNPQIHLLGKVGWDDNILTQIGRLVRIGGHPYVFTTDEFGASSNPADACEAGKPPYGYVHVVDVADERNPKVVNTLRLEVNDPANCAQTLREQNGSFPLMYSSHYCDADDPDDTTAIACAWLSSGVRVFDVRDPLRPREIAYFNPGGRSDTQRGNATSFEVLLGSRTKDASPSQVRWRRTAGGETQLWTMSSLGGLEIVRFTNGVYPFAKPLPCIAAQGAIRGRSLGPVRLGSRMASLRSSLGDARRSRQRGLDSFCVAGGGTVRVGQPTARLRQSLARAERRRVAGRAVLALTSSTRFSLAGVKPGTSVRRLRSSVRGLRRTVLGRRTWYSAASQGARLLFRTDGRRVLEVGIADRRVTSGAAAIRRFLLSWRGLR